MQNSILGMCQIDDHGKSQTVRSSQQVLLND